MASSAIVHGDRSARNAAPSRSRCPFTLAAAAAIAVIAACDAPERTLAPESSWLAALVLTPGASSSETIDVNQSVQLAFVDANGVPIAGTKWTTGNAAVASVSASGLVTGSGPGTTVVMAKAKKLSAAWNISVTGTVRPIPPDTFSYPGADSLTCAGYPEKRIFLETQAWWESTGLSIPDKVGRHIHVGTCFPVGIDGSDNVTITGPIGLDVRLMLHNSNGPTSWLRWQVEDSTIQRKTIVIPAVADTTVWTTLALDTANVSPGRHDVRISLNIPLNSEGNRQFNSGSFQLCFQTCSPSYRIGQYVGGRGWYTGHDYARVRFTSKLPVAPVSGNWTINFLLEASQGGGVYIDPDFHLGSAGITVMTASSPVLAGSVTIDTAILSNGSHRLVLVSHDGFNGGVLVIPFTVANETSPGTD